MFLEVSGFWKSLAPGSFIPKPILAEIAIIIAIIKEARRQPGQGVAQIDDQHLPPEKAALRFYRPVNARLF